MDHNLLLVTEKKIERIIKNLEKNNMNGYYVQNTNDVQVKVQELIKKGDTVAVGGSMTLYETGVIDLLRSGEYNFLDRHKEGLTNEEVKEIYRKSFFTDVYLTSCNAITENGWLYNVDGRGNRVAAMIYGPDKVILIVGINKIVRNLEEAIERVKNIAAPANTIRLNKDTPCTRIGYCSDCKNDDRICNDYVLIKRQSEQGRIHVIIVNKELGY